MGCHLLPAAVGSTMASPRGVIHVNVQGLETARLAAAAAPGPGAPQESAMRPGRSRRGIKQVDSGGGGGIVSLPLGHNKSA